eukprot:TRINITY_DN46941_c0_g1_i1.p1 TRINITY_DN46941_c0_g1~~TRINITY_DN46941_c0_g1_i1.p1  ORF type:complete len:520 (+),score=217.48 TRINITY_DN46941_c0_g1_i1:138-1697(+)
MPPAVHCDAAAVGDDDGLLQLLDSVGMAEYHSELLRHDVSKAALFAMEERDLEARGIPRVVHRRKLMRAVEELKRREAAPAAAPEPSKKVHVQNPSSKPCRLWVKTGACGFGESCKFVHADRRTTTASAAAPSSPLPAPPLPDVDAEELGQALLSLSALLRPSTEERAGSVVPQRVCEQHARRLCPAAVAHVVGSRGCGVPFPESGTDVVVEHWSGNNDRLRRDLVKSGYAAQLVPGGALVVKYPSAGGTPRTARLWLFGDSESPQRRLSDLLRRRLDSCGGAARAAAVALRLLLREAGMGPASQGGLSGVAAALLVAAADDRSGADQPPQRAAALFLHCLRLYAAWDWERVPVLLDAQWTSRTRSHKCCVVSPYDADVNLAAELDTARLSAACRDALTALHASGVEGLEAVVGCSDMLSARKDRRRRASAAADGVREKQLAVFQSAQRRALALQQVSAESPCDGAAPPELLSPQSAAASSFPKQESPLTAAIATAPLGGWAEQQPADSRSDSAVAHTF